MTQWFYIHRARYVSGYQAAEYAMNPISHHGNLGCIFGEYVTTCKTRFERVRMYE